MERILDTLEFSPLASQAQRDQEELVIQKIAQYASVQTMEVMQDQYDVVEMGEQAPVNELIEMAKVFQVGLISYVLLESKSLNFR